MKKNYGMIEYKINYWCDFTEKNCDVKGVVYAASLNSALNILEQYYGADSINTITMNMLEPSKIYEFDDEFNDTTIF